MKINRRHKESAEVSTESMNDIMFFLLLFFLIVSTLVNPSVIKLTLPNSTPGEQLQKQKITITVSPDREYFVNQKQVEFSDLEAELANAIDRTKSPTVVLKMDNTLPIQDLADVMQLGYALKVKMVLATKATNK